MLDSISIYYQSITVGYALRCRSLRDLHYRGPQAQGGVRSVKTEPTKVTNVYIYYHGLYVYSYAMATLSEGWLRKLNLLIGL